MHLKRILIIAASIGIASARKFLFTGANEAGAAFGRGKLLGRLNKDYVWPTNKSIDILSSTGMNTFRVPIRMERLIPQKLTGSINEAYFNGLSALVEHATNKGLYVVVTPDNEGRYYGKIIKDIQGFGAWWKTVAERFVKNDHVIFDTNNEFHHMDNALVRDLNQAAIDAIRAAGAKSQYIFVEGNNWSSAWSWVRSGTGKSLIDLKDPENRIVYEMHQYLDRHGSGRHENCVSLTVGKDRLRNATEWLRENKKQGILGETASGSDEVCVEAMTGMLQFMVDNSDVWKGWLWWAAGPWWGKYMFSIEPPNGKAYKNLMGNLKPFIDA